MASTNKDDPILRLKNNLVNIWKSSEYSDLLIRCNNGDEHRAHRVILCSQSEFFRRACNPKTGFKEALSGIIELRHDDPSTVRAMLEFCYTFTYTPPPPPAPQQSHQPAEEDRMIFHVHMYAVGDIYAIPALKRLAVQNFERDVSHRFPRFPAAVRAIYETTPATDRALRDVALRVCAAHARDLLGDPAFDEMMDELGVFGRELAREMLGLASSSSGRGGGGGGGANGANGVNGAPPAKNVVVDCRRYRCSVCRRAVAWNIPKPCPTELLQCMYCGAGFAPATWKKRLIRPDDPPEPEDLAERPSSVAGEDGGAGW
ncbi:btb poz-like protein [Diplodia corticola]|uniref:Btb poz-like protein n=1 Tax=Diplodia corticola TaxID=236234 RepID=A0A1J9RWS8_9PEZI|nr:btb poz-like protein [Diplodia corticola]OJD32300.1 btb poz-like protein [Diplodia corticola]